MKLITNVLITAATAALSAQAALVSFTVTMPTGGGGGVFDNITGVGSVGGSAYLTTGTVAKADIVDCTTGTLVSDLSLIVLPSSPGSNNIFYGGPLTLTSGELTRYLASDLCIQLIDGGGNVLSSGRMVVPEPEVYAGAAGLALAGFALWRRRKA
jgi:hypothetical protein